MGTSQARTSSGTTFSVSTASAALLNGTSYVLADFTGLTFTPVGELSDLGSFGKKFNLVTFNPLGDRKTSKFKSSYNNGTLGLKLASAPTNAGQILMQVAAESDNAYAFRVVTQSGSTFYFTGKTMSWLLEIGSVDQIMGASADVEIDGDILTSVLVA